MKLCAIDRGRWSPDLKSLVCYCLLFFQPQTKIFFEITEKNYVISVRVSENIGYWTLLRRVLMQLWDRWLKCVRDQNVSPKTKYLTEKKDPSCLRVLCHLSLLLVYTKSGIAQTHVTKNRMFRLAPSFEFLLPARKQLNLWGTTPNSEIWCFWAQVLIAGWIARKRAEVHFFVKKNVEVSSKQ